MKEKNITLFCHYEGYWVGVCKKKEVIIDTHVLIKLKH